MSTIDFMKFKISIFLIMQFTLNEISEFHSISLQQLRRKGNEITLSPKLHGGNYQLALLSR
jgi:hypothetical protein